MAAFASVQKGDDDAGVEEDRGQRPKPLRCFLLDPRSETAEAN
jgi:hypothetical protein